MKNIFSSLYAQFNKVPGLFKKKKFLYGTIAVAVLLIAGVYYFWGGSKSENGYLTSTVKKGTVAKTIPATGTIEPVSTVSLSFKNAEIINKIYVKVGDHVTTGQLMAEQEEDALQAQMIQSSASLKGSVAKLQLLENGATQEEITKAEVSVYTAQASYDQAKANLDRYQKLFDAGAVSQSELDSANSSYVSANGNLKQVEASLQSIRDGNRPEDIAAAAATVESGNAQLNIAQKELAGAKMTSPINGIVSAVNGGEGQRATANNNTTSSTSGFIALISEALQVEAQVNEADIGNLQIGQAAELTVNSFPNKTFTGRVSSISPIAATVSNVQVYDTVIQLDNNQTGLKAGMPATITIIVDKSENTLTVPKGAVTYAAKQSGSGGGRNVIVMDKSGNLETRQVELGLSDSSSYEVLAGLNEGETVIIGTGSASTTGSGTSSGSGNSTSTDRTSGTPFMGGPR